ncbi:MAG: Non-specific serine/threonine protein kinase [Candidatus Hydrogenedentes bacterium]|nr:Non-specific serine/threonine protein kinase [Candidatus Hydrogenedentota bacterium]
MGSMLAGRFRLERHLGRGGLGDVWMAYDVQLDDDPVACKILRDDLFYDRRAIADLKREVLLTRRVRHPHILAVYTVWDTPERRFITMEYIEGHNLMEALIKRHTPFPVDQVLPWVQQVCQALDFAHAQQILHRDVKPGNILLDKSGDVWLADFGIARTAQEVRTRFTGEMTSGTLLFMSPEQLLGERLDGRSDLYSLAATIYELVKGTPPFFEGSIIMQIQMKPVPPVPHLGEEVNAVLLKALSKTPSQRQSSCGEFCAEFTEAVQKWVAQHPSPVTLDTEIAPHRSFNTWNPDAETVQLHLTGTEEHHPRIGMLLVDAGIVTAEQLEEALRIQEQTQAQLGTVLVNLGYVAEEVISDAVGEQLQVPFVKLDEQEFDPDVTRLISGRIARLRRSIPIRREGDCIVVAMADPLDLGALNELERVCKERVDVRIAPDSVIKRVIEHIYGPDSGQEED